MARATDAELEHQYETGEAPLTQERNDFLLPQILDFVRDRRWMNLRPEYQRRQVWDKKTRSLFIESLLMNVPVPPVFLFEWEYGRYEVIDGQQRLSAITDFFANEYKLTGLDLWKSLNGRQYSELPPMLQRGLERRRISAVVLLAENLSSPSRQYDIRRLMFERLNTGGLNLNPQELRNCLWAGPFNQMLIELAADSLFDDIWEIPRHAEHVRGGHVARALADNTRYKRMHDCEIVLRFFAFRQHSAIRGAVKKMLDKCMEVNQHAGPESIAEMKDAYRSRLRLASELFGQNVFRLPPDEKGRRALSEPLYDAVMISLDRLFDRRDELLARKVQVVEALAARLEDRATPFFGADDKRGSFFELVVGRGNTAEAIKDRLDAMQQVLEGALGGTPR